jgi:hypothetical protein
VSAVFFSLSLQPIDSSQSTPPDVMTATEAEAMRPLRTSSSSLARIEAKRGSAFTHVVRGMSFERSVAPHGGSVQPCRGEKKKQQGGMKTHS